ncbi:GNAT family N-acetyltransferase [Bifidobacterium sp. ESL0745]|uniref:GNAT family N-acetyltransferase n=1 Tax=Bifidobacterium sp. ESL0745 TaxID=2983226 RepID=UPI0023F89FB5|nr:GNAT family N-acetyltransferase [Bifidobacterium sp. ESL0745]MDF7665191.1 GNAT family N-acetyltransferase [Bifidobacterium sp. ESL0745]
MCEISIRQAVRNDAAALQKLNKNCLGYDYPLDRTSERLAELLANPDCRIFVAEKNGNAVGYVQANTYKATYGDPAVNVMGLAVSQDARGNHAGRRLMEAVEAWARNINAKEVRLNSAEFRKDAHKFYQAIGYTLDKMQTRFGKRLR